MTENKNDGHDHFLRDESVTGNPRRESRASQLGELGDSICTLVGNARSGCNDSRNELMQQLRNYMRIVAASRMNSKFQSKFGESDVVQQSIAIAIEKFSDFRGGSEKELFAWVSQILRNEMLQQQRALMSGKRNLLREKPIEGENHSSTLRFGLADSQHTPQTNAIREEQVQSIESAIQKLPEDHQTVIRLRNLQQLSFSEIGLQMNRSENAATKLWYRALVQLRQALEKDNG